MAINTTLSGLSQSYASNGPDGASDAPSTFDDAVKYALAFTAMLRDAAHVYAASISGTNTITGTIAQAPTAYLTGQVYRFIAAGANTGAATLNLNGLGAKAITKKGTSPLVGGEISSGACIEVMYDGTQFQLMGLSHIASGTAVTASGTSVDFTSIPSWVKRITVSISGLSTNGASNPLIQLGDSGGIEATGYIGAGGNNPNASANSNTSFTTGFGIVSSNASNTLYGALTLTLVNPATNLWVATGVFSVPSGPSMQMVSGSKSLSATLDRVRLTTVNGTDAFDAGTVNVIYE